MILPYFSYTTHIHRPPPHQPQRWERGLDLWLNCFSTTLLIILRRRQRIPQSFWTMRRSRGWILVLWSNSLEYHLPNPRTLLLPKSNLTYVSFSFPVSDIFLKKDWGFTISITRACRILHRTPFRNDIWTRMRTANPAYTSLPTSGSQRSDRYLEACDSRVSGEWGLWVMFFFS